MQTPTLGACRAAAFTLSRGLDPRCCVRRRILAQFSRSARAEVAALLGGEKKVINSGVILAPPAAMLRHVDALVDEMWALGGRYDRWMVGVDQAAHMLLVRSHHL